MAWALAHGIVQAQPDAPLELIRPEDAVYVRKYYEAQFGADRCDEMIRHASTNVPLKVLLEKLDVELRLLKSQSVIRKKMNAETDAVLGRKTEFEPAERLFLGNNSETIEAATRLLLAYAGEDYHAALPAIEAKRNSEAYDVSSRGKTTLTATEKEMIIAGSARGGISTGWVHARWMLDGVEVVKNETRGWSQFAKCAEFSPLATEQYAGALLTKKGNPESYALSAPLYLKIVTQYPDYDRSGVSHYHARLAAEKLGAHVDYLTTGYVELARFGSNRENSGLSSYEREHGDKSSTWWPWSKPNRIVAQERASDIISKFKTIENPKLDRSARSFSKADQVAQALVKLVDKAHDGDSISMYDLGIAYLNGLNGFPKNPEVAREWFRLSSARGFVPGTYNYAICLNEAVGGPADPKEAARLFRIGAMRGDPLSQHNLGVAYGIGRGVERDYVEAIAWWHLCKSKVPQVKASLDKVDGPKYRSIAEKAKLRSEELRKEIGSNLDSLKKDLIW
jgi:TPR repeat protein